MNFVHGVFYITIFSNMAQRQRARYRDLRYVIVNNVATTSVSNSFKDGSSKLNNHSAMSLVSLFLRFLFNLNFVLFYGCLPLDFVWKWYEIKL